MNFTPYSTSQQPLISDRQEHPLPKHDMMPWQPHAAVLMRAISSGKYKVFSSFAQKTSNVRKKTFYQSPTSLQQMQLLKQFLISKGPAPGQLLTCEAAQQCPSSRPWQEMLHTLKRPSRARLRSLRLLYIKPPRFCVAHLSQKLKVRTVYLC